MVRKNLQTLDIIEVMEAFLSRKRPPEHIRPKLDLGYKLEDQSVIIHEIRPRWNDPSIFIYPEVAKATYVKSADHWKVFWRLSNGTWTPFKPKPAVKHLQDFVKLVEEDSHHCFWG
jgi:hypothetical protein